MLVSNAHNVAQLVTGIFDHPRFDLMSENDDQSGHRKRDKRDGHQQQRP
jgi:hypothetical protein